MLLLIPKTCLESLVKIRSVTAQILLTLTLWSVGGWVVVMGGGVESHFHVKPNLGYVRLRLICVVVELWL